MKLGEILKATPRIRTAIATVGLTSVGGLLGWLGTSTLRNLEEVERMAVESRARIDRLERDDAKWGTLAEQEKKLIDLRVEVEVLKRLYGTPVRPESSRSASIAVPLPAQASEKIDLDKFKQQQERRYDKK